MGPGDLPVHVLAGEEEEVLLAGLLEGVEGPAVDHVRVLVIARAEPGDGAQSGVLGLAVPDAGGGVEVGGVSLAHVVANLHVHVIVPVKAAEEPGVLHRVTARALKIQVEAGVVGGRNARVDISLGVQSGVGAGGIVQKGILLRQQIVPQPDLGLHILHRFRTLLRRRLRRGLLDRLCVRAGRHHRRGHAEALLRRFPLRGSAAGGKAQHQQPKQDKQQDFFHQAHPFCMFFPGNHMHIPGFCQCLSPHALFKAPLLCYDKEAR